MSLFIFSFTLSLYAETTVWLSAILLAGPNGLMNGNKSHKCNIFKLEHTAQATVSQTLANSTLESWDEENVPKQTQSVIKIFGFTNVINFIVRFVSLKYTANIGGIKVHNKGLKMPAKNVGRTAGAASATF